MPFVTNYNYKQIQRSYFFTKNFTSKRELFHKPITVFNLLERNNLLLYQMLLESKGNISQYPECEYLEFKRELPKNAAYHFYKDCKNLNANYIEIKNINGTEEIVDGTERRNSGVFDWNLKEKLTFYEKEVNDLLVAIEDIAKSDSLIKSYARKTFLLNGQVEKLKQ